MTCSYCGTELPTGALFCGECGRAVVFAAETPSRPHGRLARPAAHRPAGPVVEEPGGATARAGTPVPSLVEPGPHGIGIVTCAQCGAPMAEEDIFCGECGFVSRAASEDFGRSRDTAIIELEPRAAASPKLQPPRVVDRLPDFESAPQAPPVPTEPATPPPVASGPGAPELVAPEPVAPALVAPELVAPEPVAPALVAPELVAPAPNRPSAYSQPPTRAPTRAPVESRPSRSAPFDEAADLEPTRISRAGRAGERFVLQFSTGESFTVYGTGLIGRNPRSEPGEYFDQLVRVLDPSRSVSKVHLEFGQEAGNFWIMDRFSGNGTIIREPDSAAVRCQPDKRYRLSRGTRVEIGEQFFIVS